jgi:hypothetical protein
MNIQCSKLEKLRLDPKAFAKILAADEISTGGGVGMLSYFKIVARKVHIGELDLNDGIKELSSKLISFSPTSKNKARQDYLLEAFVKYFKAIEKQKIDFVSGQKRISRDFGPHVKLTGLSPWILTDSKKYISYFISEWGFDWESELRFPLYQEYLAHHLDCKTETISVGIYNLEDDKLEIKSFSSGDILTTVQETGQLFDFVYKEYKKLKV